MRENLLEIDNLRYLQDEFFKELHECFGLEKCLREASLTDGPPQSGGQLGAGALLASLREERATLRARHSQLESRFNEIRKAAEGLASSSSTGYRQRGSSSSSSYSYSSSSSSSSSRSYGSSGRYPQVRPQKILSKISCGMMPNILIPEK